MDNSKRATRLRMALLALLIATASATACAQGAISGAAVAPTGRGTHFCIGLLLGYDEARDDLLLPMRWGGLGLGLRGGFERVGERTYQQAVLLFPVSLMQNRFDHKALALGLEARYTIEGLFRRSIASGTASFGGQLKWDLHDGFYQSWDEEHIYWLTAYSVGPHGAWRRATGPGATLGIEVDLPLIAAVSRPPAVRFTKIEPLTHLSHHLFHTSRDLELTRFPHYTAAHLGVAMTRKWGRGRLIFSYDFELSSYDRPARVTTISSRFGITRAGGL